MTGDLVTPVILSGGSGTRLWPLSRRDRPKQFLPLDGDATLLQETARRVAAPRQFAPPLVVCNEDHRFMVAEQLRGHEPAPRAILLEPVARSTAPALTAAALWLLARDPDAIMLALPADHAVRDVPAFREAAGKAAQAARSGLLVTFGITPRSPETGFGYIAAGDPIEGLDGPRRVAGFVEKPDPDAARKYVEDGSHFWNSGMFVFRADALVAEIDRLAPETGAACRAAVEAGEEGKDFFRLGDDAFAAAPAVPIDYAIMEKTDRAAVVPVEMGWSDMGSWRTLWEIGARDDAGNILAGDVVEAGARNCYLRADGTLVAAIGLEDTVVVASGDAVLVAAKRETHRVRDIVERLGRAGRAETVTFPEVQRAWGRHRTLGTGPGFRVRRISLHPGARISLPVRRHAVRHWTVVEGAAGVTLEGETHVLMAGASLSIPAGAAHALAADGSRGATLIEVEAGPDAGGDGPGRPPDA